MATRDPRIDDDIANAAPFAKPIPTRIRKAVHAGSPQVTETLKWSTPTFEYKGILCGMTAFEAHCVLGSWTGTLVKTPVRDRFESIDDVPSEAALVKLVNEAAALNDAGVKVPRAAKTPKKPLSAPSYMLAAIKKNKKAQAIEWMAAGKVRNWKYVR